MHDLDDLPSIRKLKVDLSELEIAFENTCWEMAYYLDLSAGHVVLVTDEMRGELEILRAEAKDEETQTLSPEALEAALRRHDLPEWECVALRGASQVETSYGTRYLRVPPADSREGYADMEAFIGTVYDEPLRERLWRAIQGQGRAIASCYPQAKCKQCLSRVRTCGAALLF